MGHLLALLFVGIPVVFVAVAGLVGMVGDFIDQWRAGNRVQVIAAIAVISWMIGTCYLIFTDKL
jgi:hypothetical protein